MRLWWPVVQEPLGSASAGCFYGFDNVVLILGTMFSQTAEVPSWTTGVRRLDGGEALLRSFRYYLWKMFGSLLLPATRFESFLLLDDPK